MNKPTSCPKCHSSNVEIFGRAWRCLDCQATFGESTRPMRTPLSAESNPIAPAPATARPEETEAEAEARKATAKKYNEEHPEWLWR